MTEVLCSDPQKGRHVYYFILKNTAAYVINGNERQKVRSKYYRKGVSAASHGREVYEAHLHWPILFFPSVYEVR